MKSMTGYAKVHREDPEAAVDVEIRTLNGRFLKIATSITGVPLAREEALLSRVRSTIRRGAVHLTLHYRPTSLAAPFRVDRAALTALLTDIDQAVSELGHEVRIDPTSLLVHDWLLEPVEIPEATLDRDWPGILAALDEALGQLVAMRTTEGASLRTELSNRAAAIRTAVDGIVERVGPHLDEFRTRLRARIEQMLGREGTPVREEDIARELVYYAERCDITEELDRIGSHLRQYFDLLEGGGEIGRKLEFVVQEILREINTVGSKTYDQEAAQAVILIKGELEKIKEQLQNVE